jgi:Fe-S-cluster containining protein
MDSPDDARRLGADENARLCEGCVRCCSYITIEIDKPRTSREYDQWIWALHHRGISLYVERPEAWFIHVDTRCEQLDARGRCAIHGRHPVLCREYDPRTCERRLPLADIVGWFDTAEQFEAWIRARRPAHWRKLEAWRAEAAAASAPPASGGDATVIPLAALLAPAVAGAVRGGE